MYYIAQNYRILHRVVQRLSQHNPKIRTIAILKASSNTVMISTELVDMSMIFYCTKLHLFEVQRLTSFLHVPCSFFFNKKRIF
jgi:hypothetical protein